MRDFLNELGMKRDTFLLHCDNKSVIHPTKNVAYHSRTKHIQRRHHWLCKRVDGNEFDLVNIHTDKDGLDMLTIVLSMDKLRTVLVHSPSERGVCCEMMSLIMEGEPNQLKGRC